MSKQYQSAVYLCELPRITARNSFFQCQLAKPEPIKHFDLGCLRQLVACLCVDFNHRRCHSVKKPMGTWGHPRVQPNHVLDPTLCAIINDVECFRLFIFGATDLVLSELTGELVKLPAFSKQLGATISSSGCASTENNLLLFLANTKEKRTLLLLLCF